MNTSLRIIRLMLSVCTMVLLFGMSLKGAVYADTASVHDNALTAHSFFHNSHWRLVQDTLEYHHDNAYSALTPRSSCGAGAGDTDCIVFSDGTDLYAMSARMTDGYILTTAAPVLLSGFDGAKPYDCNATASGDTTVVVSVNGTSSVYCAWVSTATGSVFARDTIVAAGADIHAVGLVRSSGFLSVVIGGAAGLLGVANVNSFPAGSARLVPMDVGQTVTAVSDSLLGTSDGSIYRLFPDSTAYVATPGPDPIRCITERVAVGDNGMVLINESGVWSGYTSGMRSLRSVNMIGRTDGLGVEHLDDSLRYTVTTVVPNRPTSFAVTLGAAETPVVSGNYQMPSIGTDTIRIHVTDPDLNGERPQVYLDSQDLLAEYGGTPVSIPSYPDTAPTPGLSLWNDSVVTLLITADSIAVQTAVRTGVMDPFTLWKSWTHGDAAVAASFSPLTSSLGISCGGVVFELHNPSTTTISGCTSLHRAVSVVRTSSELQFVFTPGSVKTVSLADLRGRVVDMRENLTGASSLVISTTSLAAGTYCAILGAADGSQSTRLIQIIH